MMTLKQIRGQMAILHILVQMLCSFRCATPTEDCVQNGNTLTCRHSLPENIKYGVSQVFITDYSHKTLTEQKHVFANPTWNRITTLDITANFNTGLTDINEYDFADLNNVEMLGIHSRHNLIRNEKHTFAGLDKLEYLNLAGCSRQDPELLTGSIMSNNGYLPKLKKINLRELYSSKAYPFILTAKFLNMLKIKCIQWLDVSGTKLLLQDISLLNDTYCVEHFIGLNVTFYMKPLKVRDHRRTENCFLKFVHKIKTIMIDAYQTGIQKRQSIYQDKTKQVFPNVGYLIPVNLTKLQIDNFFFNISTNNYTLDLSKCAGNLKTLSVRGSCIKKLNLTVIFPETYDIIVVDLSANEMEYISPHVFDTQHSLKSLILSKNNLYQMEKNHEFEILLNTFHQLEYFDMAFNELTFIPNQMFANNTLVRLINLKGNRLKSFTFNITHLTSLETLNLQANKILYLDKKTLATFTSIFQTRTHNVSKHLSVDFRHNPLQCSCDRLDFIIWLAKEIDPSIKPTCILEGDSITIDQTAVEQYRNICYRDAFIATISVATVVMIVGIVVTTVCTIHKIKIWKNRDKVRLFLKEYKNRNTDERYLAFLSNSSEDKDLVWKDVYNPLNLALKEMFQLDDTRKHVCNGDVDFIPGHDIITEITRCVKESYVVIFIISQDFCKSAWCRKEVNEARVQEKPIILVFLEEIETNRLPEYLQNVFHRYARVKLVARNGSYELVPKLETLCQSIVHLACKTATQVADDTEIPLLSN